MRSPARKYVREELVAYLHGIDTQGDLAHILVHKRGNQIRFEGRLGDHQFVASNTELDGWVQEAENVYGLEGTMGVARGAVATPETLLKVAELNLAAAQKKKALGLQVTDAA